MTRVDEDLLGKLVGDGLLQRAGATQRTTRRWQAAMMRAALTRIAFGDDEDPRVAIVTALLELYGDEVEEDLLAGLAQQMLTVEARELGWTKVLVRNDRDG